MRNLVWLKSDLRVSDNPALTASMASGETLAVFVLCPDQWQVHNVSAAKQSLVLRQLVSLRRDLAALNVPLLVVQGDSFQSLPRRLVDVSQKFGVKRIFWNKEYELNEKRCEQALSNLCQDALISVYGYDDSVLCAPGSIVKLDGSSYKVFSAFKRALLKDIFLKMRPMYPAPQPQYQFDLHSDIKFLSDEDILRIEGSLKLDQYYTINMHERWPAGEEYAHSQLEQFIQERSYEYDKRRDFPGEQGTSVLSPYLAIGAISTRQCLQSAVNENRGSLDEGQPGIVSWINELVWREFYRHILASDESLCRFKPFKPETDNLPWRHDQQQFELWKVGKTGYPIVDAAMRQLNETGWMHNRLRMVVSMFLTKHLFIDWRWGEWYFMSKLVDGDFASNNGGWQWSASTGVDAVPYFRIFNPTRQSIRFDPDGNFIRRFVPELRSLSSKHIHQPSNEQALALGYALPMVDHKEATGQTKLYFSQLNTSLVTKGSAIASA